MKRMLMLMPVLLAVLLLVCGCAAERSTEARVIEDALAQYEPALIPGVDEDTVIFLYSAYVQYLGNRGGLYFAHASNRYYDGGSDRVTAYVDDGMMMAPVSIIAIQNVGLDSLDTIECTYYSNPNMYCIRQRGQELFFVDGEETIVWNDTEYTLTRPIAVRGQEAHIPLQNIKEIFGLEQELYASYSYDETGEHIDRLEIWFSTVQLIPPVEFTAELDSGDYLQDDNHYFQDAADAYYLKEGAETQRGIRVGDRYEDMIAAYGEPHDQRNLGGINTVMSYSMPDYPDSWRGQLQGTWLCFYLEGSFVTRIEIIRFLVWEREEGWA